MKRSLVLTLALLSLAVAYGGCKKIQRMLPATTVDTLPDEEGSPKWLVYKAIEAAQIPDIKASWKAMRPLVHSRVLELRTSENNFVNMNFTALRRKINLLTPEDGKPGYKLDYTEEDEEDRRLRLFVVNEASDMPAPFRIERDPGANNEWRIKNIP